MYEFNTPVVVVLITVVFCFTVIEDDFIDANDFFHLD